MDVQTDRKRYTSRVLFIEKHTFRGEEICQLKLSKVSNLDVEEETFYFLPLPTPVSVSLLFTDNLVPLVFPVFLFSPMSQTKLFISCLYQSLFLLVFFCRPFAQFSCFRRKKLLPLAIYILARFLGRSLRSVNNYAEQAIFFFSLKMRDSVKRCLASAKTVDTMICLSTMV